MAVWDTAQCTILLDVTLKLGVELEIVEGLILFVGLSRLFFTFGYSIASPVCSFASASLNPTIGLSRSAWAPKVRIAFVTDNPELFSHPGEYGDDRGVSLVLLALLHFRIFCCITRLPLCVSLTWPDDEIIALNLCSERKPTSYVTDDPEPDLLTCDENVQSCYVAYETQCTSFIRAPHSNMCVEYGAMKEES